MKQSPQWALEHKKNIPSNNHLEGILVRLFWNIPEWNMTIPLVWEDILGIIRKSKLSKNEKDFLNKYYKNRRLEQSGKVLDENKYTENLSISALDILKLEDKDIALMLVYLGPKLIHKNYWEIVLFWVWFHLYICLEHNLITEHFEEYISSNIKLAWKPVKLWMLSKAKNTMWQEHFLWEPIYTFVLYDLFMNIENFTNNLDIQRYLEWEDFSTEVVFSAKINGRGMSSKYWWKDIWSNWEDIIHRTIETELVEDDNELVRNIWETVNREWYRINLFLDSPVAVLLNYKWLPIAAIWLSIKNEDTIFINQIQTVSYKNYDRHWRLTGIRVNEIVKNVAWQKILFEIINDFTKQTWYRNIIIQSWANNRWIKEKRKIMDVRNGSSDEIDTDIPHLSLEIAKRIYDIFAQDNWFRKGKWGDWQKVIK